MGLGFRGPGLREFLGLRIAISRDARVRYERFFRYWNMSLITRSHNLVSEWFPVVTKKSEIEKKTSKLCVCCIIWENIYFRHVPLTSTYGLRGSFLRSTCTPEAEHCVAIIDYLTVIMAKNGANKGRKPTRKHRKAQQKPTVAVKGKKNNGYLSTEDTRLSPKEGR